MNSAFPTSNSGSVVELRLRSPDYHSYLKFNVSGLSGPAHSAKLRLYVTDDGPDGGAIYSVSTNYAGTSTPWTESGLTWNNAPPLSGTPLSKVGAVSLNTWVEFDVTPAVTGNGTFSFGMSSGSTNSVIYASKEVAGSQPVLVVQP